MTHEAENCNRIRKELLSEHDGMTALVQLVAVYAAAGITSSVELSRLTGYSDRAIRKAKAELGCRNQGAEGGTRVPVRNQGSGTRVPFPRVRANKEYPTDINITKESISHSHTYRDTAREGEEEVANGLFVNCKSIRHRAFAISIPAIELAALSAGKSFDEIKQFCLGHALQWALDIDNGRSPRDVVPDRVTNFLTASLMGSKNRDDVQSVRLRKAETGATYGNEQRHAQPQRLTAAQFLAERAAVEVA